MLDKLSRDP